MIVSVLFLFFSSLWVILDSSWEDLLFVLDTAYCNYTYPTNGIIMLNYYITGTESK